MLYRNIYLCHLNDLSPRLGLPITTTMTYKEITQVAVLPMSKEAIEERIKHGDAFIITPDKTKVYQLSSGYYGLNTYSSCAYPGCVKSQCRGHFGYYKLDVPVPNPLFIKNIQRSLSTLCIKCKKVDVNSRCLTCRTKIRVEFDQGRFIWHMKKEGLDETAKMVNITLVIQWITDYFISDDAREKLGYNDIYKWRVTILDSFIWYIPVPPNLLRPNGRGDTDAEIPNFITGLLSSIIAHAGCMNEKNSSINNQDAGRDNVKTATKQVADHADNVYRGLRVVMLSVTRKEYESTIEDLKLPKGASVPNHSDFESYMGALSGKEGLIRGRALAKRVKQCARTVITPNLDMGLDEVGFPRKFAQGYLVKEVRNGKVYEVPLYEGCRVMFNRNPTMTKGSIMGYILRFVDELTAQFNPALTGIYNADFDGDEMNIYGLSSEAAKAECSILMAPSNNILSPTGGAAIFPVQDCITGTFIVLRDNHHVSTRLAKEIFERTKYIKDESWDEFTARARYSGTLRDDLDGAEFSARVLLSCTYPPTFNFMSLVRNGIIQEDARMKLSDHKQIIVFMCITEGQAACERYMKLFQLNICAINGTIGISVSYDDIVHPKAITDTIKNDVISEYHSIPVDIEAGEKAVMMDNIIKRAHMKSRQYVMGRKNGIVDIVDSGAKGKEVHLHQMSSTLGMQYINGAPPRKSVPGGRILPHVHPVLMRELNDGLITSSFSSGMSPIEYFIHASAARPGIIVSSTSVSEAGSEYKELSKFSENAIVSDSRGSIMRYGRLVTTEIDSYTTDYHKSGLLKALSNPAQCDDYIARMVYEHRDLNARPRSIAM